MNPAGTSASGGGGLGGLGGNGGSGATSGGGGGQLSDNDGGDGSSTSGGAGGANGGGKGASSGVNDAEDGTYGGGSGGGSASTTEVVPIREGFGVEAVLPVEGLGISGKGGYGGGGQNRGSGALSIFGGGKGNEGSDSKGGTGGGGAALGGAIFVDTTSTLTLVGTTDPFTSSSLTAGTGTPASDANRGQVLGLDILGALLKFNVTSGTWTLGNAIHSDTFFSEGGLEKLGNGILNLGALSHTYQGTTKISRGTLQAGSSAALGNIAKSE